MSALLTREEIDRIAQGGLERDDLQRLLSTARAYHERQLALCCAVAVIYEVCAARQLYPLAPADVDRANDYLKAKGDKRPRLTVISEALQEVGA